MALSEACRTFIPVLSPFVDGELTPSERVTVERHLSACRDCTARAADLRAESGLIRHGLDLAADEVDFKDFAQKVMARLTPYRPPLLERLRVSLSEMFLYQRTAMVSSLATAAVMLFVVVPLALTWKGTPNGYARPQLAVDSVTTEAGAKVAPVVMTTDKGDAIIWLVSSEPEKVEEGAAPANGEGAGQAPEADPGASGPGKLDQHEPKGGEL